MTGSDQLRLVRLKAEPWLVFQGDHGLCGPAAVLSALLQLRPETVDLLAACVLDGQTFGTIPRSREVADRIRRRVDAKIIPKFDARPARDSNALDAKLMIGMIILLKEYLNREGAPPSDRALWEQTWELSFLWEGWGYGDPLGARPAKRPGEFSYKGGSLGMPPLAMMRLAEIMGLGVTPPEKANGSVTGSGTMALMGIGRASTISDSRWQRHGSVDHWVLVPQLPATSLRTARIWTYGLRTSLQTLSHDLEAIGMQWEDRSPTQIVRIT